MSLHDKLKRLSSVKAKSKGRWNNEDKSRHNNEEGVNVELEGGRSERGDHVRRAAKSHPLESDYSYHTKAAKDISEDNLEKLKSLPKPKLQGLASGGEVDDVEMDAKMPDEKEDGDDGLMDSVASELLDGIEKKDKKQILEGIKAIVMSMKGDQ